MKQTVLIVILTLVTIISASAQAPGRPANIGHVYGKVTDAQGKPLADASVYFLQQQYDSASRKKREVLVKGSVTAGNGEFSLAELPVMGRFRLKISAAGFSGHEQDVTFINMGGGPQGKPATGNNSASAPARPAGGAPGRMPDMSAFDKDLGNIRLSPVEKQLQAVTVTAARPLMQMDFDKKTFNVDRNLVSAGGTAADVMRNVPSVQVDIDGNVKPSRGRPR